MTGLLNRIDRVLHDQAGVALLAAVLAMGVLGFLGATFAGLVVEHQYAAVNQGQSLKALYLAEAGFELAIQELIDNTDYAFNGAAADGVIGAITNVPLGSGTVSVTKGTQTPPVFTATGTVGGVRRVLTMTIDVEGRKLVTVDPVFNDTANLNQPTNWPEFVQNPQGASGIETHAVQGNALKTWIASGPDSRFRAYREQALSQTLPPGSRVAVARLNYMRDHVGPVSSVDRIVLQLQLVRSDLTTDIVWSSDPPPQPPAPDKGVWKVAEVRGFATSPTLTTQKVRLFYEHRTVAPASPSNQTFGWFDNIEVNTVKKSAWGEP